MDKYSARETFLAAQTEMIYAAMSGAMRLPDPVLAAMLTRFRRIALILTDRRDTELMLRLEELEMYFTEESPLTGALRNMVLEARPSQVKSMIRGYLVNYVYDW